MSLLNTLKLNGNSLMKCCKIQIDGGLGEGVLYSQMQPIDLTPSTNQKIKIGGLNKKRSFSAAKQKPLFRTSLIAYLLLSCGLFLTCHTASANPKADEKPTTAATTKANKPKTEVSDNKSFPVDISADQLISQTKGGQSEYRGNVVLERNKLTLQGNSLKIIHPGDKLQQATMSGSPAKFKDYLPKKQQWVNGEAKNIVFQQDKDTITLTENAYIIMDNGNKINADKIVIYNKDETFEAFGSKQSGRVKMTIQPEN